MSGCYLDGLWTLFIWCVSWTLNSAEIVLDDRSGSRPEGTSWVQGSPACAAISRAFRRVTATRSGLGHCACGTRCDTSVARTPLGSRVLAARIARFTIALLNGIVHGRAPQPASCPAHKPTHNHTISPRKQASCRSKQANLYTTRGKQNSWSIFFLYPVHSFLNSRLFVKLLQAFAIHLQQ